MMVIINKIKIISLGLILSFCFLSGGLLRAQSTFTTNPNDVQIVTALTGNGLGISNATLERGSRNPQIATFSNGIAGAGLGIDSGVLFSTGNAGQDLTNRNISTSRSINPTSTGTDPNILGINPAASFNTVAYSFDITLDPNSSGIRIIFQFGSEEYPDYVGSFFNDVFGFFVSGPGIGDGVNPQNVALLPSNNAVIAVNSVNGGVLGVASDGTPADLTQTQFYINNGHLNTGALNPAPQPGPFPIHIEYNGITTAIVRDIAGLVPGATYRFKVAIADVGDPSYDSGVLLNQIIGLQETDLELEKEVNETSPAFGETVIFTLTASNNGPNSVNEVSVSDQLPTGYTFSSAVASKGSYDPLTGIWNIGLFENGDVETLEIQAIVNETGIYLNQASIQAGNSLDSDQTNNFAEASVTPIRKSDVGITKSINNPTPLADSNVVFTLVANNNGPNTATGVVVTDLLPSGYSFVSATSSIGNYDNVTGQWTIGDLVSGTSASLEIEVVVLPTGVYINSATIESDNFDPDIINNQSNAGIISIINCTEAGILGNTVLDDLQFLSGTGTATDLNEGDFLIRENAFNIAGTQYDVLIEIVELNNLGSGRLEIAQSGLNAGSLQLANVLATSDPNFVYDYTIIEAGSATSDNPTGTAVTLSNVWITLADIDGALGINVGEVTGFSLSTAPDGLLVGGELVNEGFLASTSAGFELFRPSNIPGENVGIENLNHAVQMFFNTFSTGRFIFGVTGSHTFTINRAQVLVVRSEDVCNSDLAIVKTVDNPTPTVGESIRFTITATNNGPRDANGVIVTDELPSEFEYIGDSSGGAYDPVTGLWTIGDLISGESITLEIEVFVNIIGVHTNTASINGDIEDPNLSNNSASVSTTTVCNAGDEQVPLNGTRIVNQ
ncbi:DUF11 domain-containing protein [Belliella sp. R4-6]|uniref:DUF11 domain-containing protein n=1 Tax=Belliella alkalica TaxID=1730871 RepID=A0ABS9VHB3_9BACT|nr:DUF11 domain-containing protein [Belliella alkalica]MCH7415842.1 DUF11 domain-containing protein [Belliella alkalica]